ncbi:MAG TPA: hypothetical protein VG347_12220 [Verrucomicrobiae bacterium]|nr:hypothetical protein [Verrucomicrobiae bacterium]
MHRCRPEFKPWFCALLIAAAWPVVAQQSVVFTKPTDLPTDKANDFMGDAHKTSGTFNAPSPFFSSGKPQADYDILPGVRPPHTPSPAEIKQWQKSSDERQNWTLMTPEQILNLPTPEKILGLPDPNHEENLSIEEKYIRRQERQRSFSATNALRHSEDFLKQDDNPFQTKNIAQQQLQDDRRAGTLSTSRYGLGPAVTAPPITDAGRDPDSIWHSAFNVMPAVPKPDPIQVAAMERFRAMMEPPVVAKPAVVSSFSTPAPVVDHNMQAMPAYNPAGHSFSSLENNSGRPIGINPLPTITGERPSDNLPQPKPLVKLPPWMTDGPQAGTPPRSKF